MEVGLLAEAAMSMRQYAFVDTLLSSLRASHPSVLTSTSFRERFKVYCLFQWVDQQWETPEPALVLATLQDNLPAAESDAVIQQSAAQILKRRMSHGMTMTSFRAVIDQTFPDENFDQEKQRLWDISAEFESPTRVIHAMAEKKEDEFKRIVLELADRMEKTLPVLKVSTERPVFDLDGEDDVTFSASELRDAFPGSWEEWSGIVEQTDPEVEEFLARRAEGLLPSSRLASKFKANKQQSANSYNYSNNNNKNDNNNNKKGKSAALSKTTTAVDSALSKAAHVIPAAVAPSPAVAAKKAKAAKLVKRLAAEEIKASPPSEGKRQRRFWAHEEELDLVRGVRKYGKGMWKRILLDEGLKFVDRSATDLKDKWRNLEKKKDAYERELDAEEANDDDDDDDSDNGTSNKRDKAEADLEDVVKREQPASKKQALSPKQIRESALEVRNRRLKQQQNNNN